MNEENVKRYLHVIQRSVQLIEQELGVESGAIEPAQEAPPLAEQVVEKAVDPALSPEQIEARKQHIEDLMSIDCWPPAIEDYLVADVTKEDQINRANCVLDWMIDRPVEGLDFLDFGTGDGWIARQALTRGVNSSTGYDVEESPNWATIDEVKFTTNAEELGAGSYDVIMLYDVLDHCQDPVGVMQQVKGLLKFGGVVFIRCHPWTSKHATHAYKQGLNKAYVHLFMTWDEMNVVLGEEKPMFTRVEKNPLEAYRWWFHEFNIVKERIVKGEPISQFFLVESFKELIAQEQELNEDQIKDFFKDMEMDFVDYILEK